MAIIKPRRTVQVLERRHYFKCENGAYLAFDADDDGGIIVDESNALNVTIALLGFDPATGERILDEGAGVFEWYYSEPGVVRCDACGRNVILDGFTNTCACGLDYNSSGERLAP